MPTWRLLDLGPVDGYTMTNVYEAVSRAVGSGEAPDTLILDHPSRVFVNIGFHQLMEKEIDVDYARTMGFDLVRRTIGGGAILDGPWEQDYFVVVNRRSPLCPTTVPEFYQRFLGPPVEALRKLGLDAEVRPPNDILVGGKKISGNGAISVEGSMVLAGDLLLQVPSDLFSRIIMAPSEKFQDKLAESMQGWLTSIEDETGVEPDRGRVKDALVEAFQEKLGVDLVRGALSEGEEEALEGLVRERRREEWIFSKDNDFHSLVSGDNREVKVRGGVSVSEAVHKAGKMIRVILVSKDDRIAGISISGDFFTQPYVGGISGLEERLVGTPLDEDALAEAVACAFQELGLTVFGASQEDFVETVMKAKTTER
jgi:lipoate-protein ligase A